MNEEGRTHVRYMACVYAKEIMLLASNFIIEQEHQRPTRKKTLELVNQMEESLKKIKVNLSEPLSKPTETTPDR